MIVMHFLQNAFSKITEKPSDKEEVYRRRRTEYEELRAEVAKMDSISTPRDGAKMMSAIGTISDLEAALRPCRPVEQANSMAMAPGRFS